jgi:hypothetical protein
MCFVKDAAVVDEPVCERWLRISALLWHFVDRSSLYLQGEVRFVLREQSECRILNADIPDTLLRQNEVCHLQH